MIRKRSATVPAGSQVVVIDAAAGQDAAIGDIQAPRAVIGNDTAEFRIQVVTGRGGAGAGNVSLRHRRPARCVAPDSTARAVRRSHGDGAGARA